MCRMPFSARNVLNSPEVNWEPLSDTIASGNPCVEKMWRKAVMVSDVVVLLWALYPAISNRRQRGGKRTGRRARRNQCGAVARDELDAPMEKAEPVGRVSKIRPALR